MISIPIFGLLALVLDCLLKVYIFRKISNLSISKKQVAILLAGIILLYLIHPQVSLLLEMLYLPIWVLLVLKPFWKPKQLLYYGLLPFVVGELSLRITGAYSAKYIVLIEEPFEADIFLLVLLVYAFLFIVYLLFMKILVVDFEVINQMFYRSRFNRLMWVLITGLLTYSIIVHPILVLSGQHQEAILTFNTTNAEVAIDVVFGYLILFVAGVIYLNYKSKDLLADELQTAKDNQLAALSSYSRHVESLYEELRSFRHDYTNVLVSLNLAIQERDIDQVEQIYQSVMADSDKSFYQSKYDIAKLANLQDPAMKSLLSAKLMEAQVRGIDLTVEIAEPIAAPAMDLIECIQILSIFLDNAIEATVAADHPSLLVAYFQEGREKILIIENSTAEEKLATSQLFTKGHSSKGMGRGIGLANVRQILTKYPQVSLETQSYKHRFSQVLQFRES